MFAVRVDLERVSTFFVSRSVVCVCAITVLSQDRLDYDFICSIISLVECGCCVCTMKVKEGH